MRVFIFLNGGLSDPSFYKSFLKDNIDSESFIVCADGGYKLAKSIGIVPDVLIGDLDSLEDRIDKGIKIIKYPTDKDYSDFELAMRYAESLSPEKIFVFGALGGRLDHQTINLIVLAYFNIPSVFIEKDVEVYNIIDEFVVRGKKGFLCSIVALTDNVFIKEMKGFKYFLDNEYLKPSSRGLSNIIVENYAYIKIQGGKAIFILNK